MEPEVLVSCACETGEGPLWHHAEQRVYWVDVPVVGSAGRIHRFDPATGQHEIVVEGIGITNGLGFSPDREQLYYTDTTQRAIYVFDYDEATGALANQRVAVRTPTSPDEGLPDGMTGVWSRNRMPAP
ncbi:MAG: hypothetical protein CL878_01360 [Dehalococcoidia bacterium]|nr:hypothetical protein [Dehalococcoidia bacterium]